MVDRLQSLGMLVPPAGENVTGELTRFAAGDPTAGHLTSGFYPILMFGLLGALVLASAVRDVWLRSPVRLVSLWGGLLILAAFPVRVAIGLTATWQSVAAWLIR